MTRDEIHGALANWFQLNMPAALGLETRFASSGEVPVGTIRVTIEDGVKMPDVPLQMPRGVTVALVSPNGERRKKRDAEHRRLLLEGFNRKADK